MRTLMSHPWLTLRRIAYLALAAGALSGCVVVPAYRHPYYAPYYYR